MNLNIGFPVMHKLQRQQVVKCNNLLFFDIGIEKPITNRFLYSMEFSTYNRYYRTKYSDCSIGVTVNFLSTMLEPSLNLRKEFLLKKEVLLILVWDWFVNLKLTHGLRKKTSIKIESHI